MADSKKKTNPIDTHVGSRVRLRRNMLGMSQEKLGESLGITFQQVQKYESAANRVSASRIQAIATILGVPVSFFFEGAPEMAPQRCAGLRVDDPNPHVVDFLSSAEGLQLNSACARITDAKVRRSVVNLVKALAGDEA